MTVSSIATGYDGISLLAGNAAYDPAGTFLIQRVSPTSGTSVTFSSIPSNYKHLQIRYSIITNPYEYIRFRFNGDSTSTYTSHILWGRNGSTGAEGYTVQGSGIIYSNNIEGTTDNYPNIGIIDVMDYANTSKYKTVRTFAGSDNNQQANPKSMIQLGSNSWQSTSVVNSITLITGTYATGSTIALYGMVG